VSVVEVAVKCDPTICPATDSLAYGDDVPMPTLPEPVKYIDVGSVEEAQPVPDPPPDPDPHADPVPVIGPVP